MAHAPTSCQVRVGVRVRPLTSKEIQQGGKPTLNVSAPSVGLGDRRFTYDAVFDSHVRQIDLYENVSAPLLKSFIDGYNATIMAYGQTGSGKTFTMGSEAHSEPENASYSGLIPRFISDFFQCLQTKKEESDKGKEGCPVLLDYQLTACFLEVYGEEIFDLLDEGRKPLPLREDSNGGVVIAGLTSRPVSDVAEALQVLHEGTMNRTTAATLMNLTSSRSHAVFTINLTQALKSASCAEVDLTTKSQFTFVDLAGSERMKKTGAEGERAREGIMINQGLLALGNVINALADEERLAKEKRVHVPYRQSKLTRLLQDALGGNSQTLFLACVSPSDSNASETLSTLHYANRARNIRNAPTKNVDATAAELQRLHAINRVLQCELIKQRFVQEDADDKATIGSISDELLKRKDVEDYLLLIHTAAGKLQGDSQLFTLPFAASSTPTKLLTLPPAVTTAESMTTSSADNRLALESTPNMTISERFDDSFLGDANPAEDMAILDKLLEMQQHDHDYDTEKKKDDDELQQMVGELEKQEGMLMQLRENLKVYHSLKEKYEALMGEVYQLEAEKTDLRAQLEKATADPSTGCSAAIKRKLETVELSLSRARNETKKHREKYRKAEEQARKCQALELKISELKQGKVALVKKQREAAARHREVTESKSKELLALKRKERATGQKMSKLQTEIQHHKNNLDKRKAYCQKLSTKLKQTEAHLMKLLSMRQRELNARTSLAGPRSTRRRTTALTPSCKSREDLSQDEEMIAANDEDVKSTRFVLFKMVEEKVNQASLKHECDNRVAEYSNTVRQIVGEMKKLDEAKKRQMEDPTEMSNEAVMNQEAAVADLELKLELVSSEVEEVRSKSPKKPETYRLDADEAVKKIMSSMTAPVLRALLMETFSKYADAKVSYQPLESEITMFDSNSRPVKIERQRSIKSIERKDSALQSFENEVEVLNSKIAALSRDVSHRRLTSTVEPGLRLRRLEEENAGLRGELQLMQTQLHEAKASSICLQQERDQSKIECSETKELLAVAKASVPSSNENSNMKDTIFRLHEIWKELGVDPTHREKSSMEIQTCLKDTCSRKLKEARTKRLETEEEIRSLNRQLSAMRFGLGQLPLPETQGSKALLESVDSLRAELKIVEPQWRFAIARRDRLIEEALSLSKSMCLPTDQLSKNLLKLIHQPDLSTSKGKDADKGNSGKIQRAFIMKDVQGMINALSQSESSEDLDIVSKGIGGEQTAKNAPQDSGVHEFGRIGNEFLSACEDDVKALRIKKSQILVQNQGLQEEASALAKDMHVGMTDIVTMVEQRLFQQQQGIPRWWKQESADEVARALTAGGGPPGVTTDFTRHLELVKQVLGKISRGRRSLSTALRGIVEHAQKTLLDVVGRELDASEAYASFHDALFRLPALSRELIYACISEMDALAVGVEAMTQSEIEALSVIWEAMNISSADRRAFWGDLEELVTNMANKEDPFQEAASFYALESEDWVPDALQKAREGNRELEKRLLKLEKIHGEVEKRRSRQDRKSQILSLDSEVRILNVKLADFEDIQCNKQRLTKRSGGSALLKEERFRKQMQGKFVSKLEQLASLLNSWNNQEGSGFDASLLSEDVRMLLNNPQDMETWVEQRTKFMPLRTVQTRTPKRKRAMDVATRSGSQSATRNNRYKSGISPPRARPPQSSHNEAGTGTPQVAINRESKLTSVGSASTRSSQKRKPEEKPKLPTKTTKLRRTATKPETKTNNISSSNRHAEKQGKLSRKESLALLPFGHLLSEETSPDAKENTRM